MNIKSIILAGSLLTIPFSSHAALEGVTSTVNFFKGMARNPRRVGALFPSSPSVARELVKSLDGLPEQSRILEVGAGTGQITAEIIKNLGTHTLDVVELDTDYCSVLDERFGTVANVKIVCGSITEWKPDYQYDVIICTLPFNSFDLSLTKLFIEHLQTLIRPGGAFSYIELHGITDIGKVLLPAEKKERLVATLSFMHDFKDRYVQKTVTVLFNIPPMYVHHCRMK